MTANVDALDRFLAAWEGEGIGIKTEDGLVQLRRDDFAEALAELRLGRARNEVLAGELTAANEVIAGVTELHDELSAEGIDDLLETAVVRQRLDDLLNPQPAHDPALVNAVTAYLVEQGQQADERLAHGLLDAIESALAELEPVEEEVE